MESQLVSFGNFLLKTYGVQVHSTDGSNIPLSQRMVSDADLIKWENSLTSKDNIPEHEVGKAVWLYLWEKAIIAEVVSVGIHNNKITYDLKLVAHNGENTRIYRVDSQFVKTKHPDTQTL